jgi:hypothetical protein
MYYLVARILLLPSSQNSHIEETVSLQGREYNTQIKKENSYRLYGSGRELKTHIKKGRFYRLYGQQEGRKNKV